MSDGPTDKVWWGAISGFTRWDPEESYHVRFAGLYSEVDARLMDLAERTRLAVKTQPQRLEVTPEEMRFLRDQLDRSELWDRRVLAAFRDALPDMPRWPWMDEVSKSYWSLPVVVV